MKRQAQLLREQAEDAFLAGDYRRTAALDREILERQTDPDAVSEAADELERLAPDPWAIRIGVVAMVIYAAVWAFSLL